ncbi:Rieske 2Fe-2S domain-containing protein [Paraburkholderia sp.]|uniref:Rieske 2Fe-2S domain-containing protein n=1 Tax=Paraburkholderia sp. TaxID=1926495 RepID=UPI003C7E952E
MKAPFSAEPIETVAASDKRSGNPGPFGGYYAPVEAPIDAEITRTDRGTSLGEYMRKFWQPVCLASDLRDVPLAIRILGEDLVAFRDLSGNVGVLARRCAHRGASLEYGIIAEHGIRCCYHGWQFDVDGRVLSTPGEPLGSRLKDSVCQGAYPAFEKSGLVFAYMGPPAEKPPVPEYEAHAFPPDNKIVPFSNFLPCNWLQVHENIADQAHAVFLHVGMTIDPDAKAGEGTQLNASFGIMPTLEWVETRDGSGMVFIAGRRIGDRIWIRINDLLLPNITQHAHLFEDGEKPKIFANHLSMTRWAVPVDDTHTQLFGWRYFNDLVDPEHRGDASKCGKEKIDFLDGQVGNRPYEEGQRNPGDWEVLTSQGPISSHKLEHPGTTDAGLFLWRRLVRRAIRGQAPGASAEAIASLTRRCNPLPMYSQDSVLNIPARDGTDDQRLMREIGRRVFDIIVEADGVDPAARDSYIREQIRALEKTASA